VLAIMLFSCHIIIVIIIIIIITVGRDSSVGIATRYEVDGAGIECRYGRRIPYLSRQALGPKQPPIQRLPGPFLGVKRPGRGVDQPPHIAPRFKKE
jgi:hypothetical protein